MNRRHKPSPRWHARFSAHRRVGAATLVVLLSSAIATAKEPEPCDADHLWAQFRGPQTGSLAEGMNLTQYRLLHENPLDEMALASPTLTSDDLFIRTHQHVYRIQQPG